ncbi:class I SAM-dependent methyltransferase [Mucilaginibacter sp. PAMB04168]|uniref:class I SAM-dependent methyltransferase n=1 Tax=Mucilaginibacter sp. PAMB04168 TaxID=3138567 RepID=UPI0031F61D50
MPDSSKAHWEKIYQTKNHEQVSWTQAVPQNSLDFIYGFDLPKTAKIIDIGGGDSKLVDHLLEAGFINLTVLDISATALEKTKLRLGKEAETLKWIVADITEFQPEDSYDLWHDRATFHFLTGEDAVNAYVNMVAKAVSQYLVIGTFSENGPETCSGLPVRQYTATLLQQCFQSSFKKICCRTKDHTTPFQTTQNFLFCSFKRL